MTEKQKKVLQSPDLNKTEMAWWQLTRVMHKQNPNKVKEL